MEINRLNYKEILSPLIEQDLTFKEEKVFIYFEVESLVREYVYYSGAFYLSGRHVSNDCIFQDLDLNAIKFCTEVYGYSPRVGCFPEAKKLTSIRKIIYALFEKCEEKDKGIKTIHLKSLTVDFLKF